MLKCASGATASATTASDGTWSASLKTSDYPCAARVVGGQANGKNLASALHSVAAAPGTTNITPLTDIIVAVLGKQDPDAWFNGAKNGDTSKIFPRAMPGKTPDNLTRLVNGFYSSMLLFDMALQWVVTPGPFRYDFSWLTGESENHELVTGAKRQFVQFYGLDPDSFDLIDSPNVPAVDKRDA